MTHPHLPRLVLLILLARPGAADPPSAMPPHLADAPAWLAAVPAALVPAERGIVPADDGGVAITFAGVPDTWRLRTTGIRQGAARADAAPPLVDDDGETTTLDQGPVTTWWRAPDRQRGLEQGWTLPAPIGAGPLVIEVATDAPASLVDGDLHLGPPDGGVRGHGLAAWDADGDAVAVVAVPTDAGFEVVVDVAGADWPVTVDPVWVPWGWSRTGPTATSGYGATVALNGDVNGDGYGDALVAAPTWSGGGRPRAGRVYLYLGSANGLATTAAVTWSGEADGDRFGAGAAFAGDLDGDGYDDVAIGAPLSHRRGEPADGALYIYLGGPNGPSVTHDQRLPGQERMFAAHVAPAGDVNGDGLDDLITGTGIGAGPGTDGYAVVLLGAPGGVSATRWLRRFTTDSDVPVVGLGDANGDGLDDVAWRGPGRDEVEIAYGTAGGGAPTIARRAVGDRYALAGLDVDQDGDADLVVGGEDGLAVYPGGPAGIASAPAATIDLPYVEALTRAGDMDGDGLEDLIATQHIGLRTAGFRNLTRVAWLRGGPSGLSATPAAFWQQPAGVSFGASLAAGRADGDGSIDVLIGAPAYDGWDTAWRPLGGRGTALLVRGSAAGPAGQPLASVVPAARTAAGDVDGDGLADLVSEPTAPGWATATYRGAPTGYAAAPDALHPASPLATHTASPTLCDVDGDGDDDLLIADRGRVRLYTSAAGALGLPVELWASTRIGNASTVAEEVLCLGDASGDGVDDFIIRWSLTVGFNPAVHHLALWLGGPAPVDAGRELAAVDGAGAPLAWSTPSVAAAGDLDADGLADVVALEPTRRELAVFLGAPGGPAAAAVDRWAPAVPAPYLLTGGVWAVGDVTGDGRADVGVVARGQTRDGRDGIGAVLRGGPGGLVRAAPWTVRPLDAHGALRTVRAAGDVDGDGHGDVLTTEEAVDGHVLTSAAAIWRGGPAGPGRLPWWQAPFGVVPAEVALLGDLDADGADELAMIHLPRSPLDLGVWVWFGDPVAPVLQTPRP